jgi:hypothetical protein
VAGRATTIESIWKAHGDARFLSHPACAIGQSLHTQRQESHGKARNWATRWITEFIDPGLDVALA